MVRIRSLGEEILHHGQMQALVPGGVRQGNGVAQMDVPVAVSPTDYLHFDRITLLPGMTSVTVSVTVPEARLSVAVYNASPATVSMRQGEVGREIMVVPPYSMLTIPFPGVENMVTLVATMPVDTIRHDIPFFITPTRPETPATFSAANLPPTAAPANNVARNLLTEIVSLPTANTEVSYTLPIGTRGFSLKERTGTNVVRFSTVAGTVGPGTGAFSTLSAGQTFDDWYLDLAVVRTLFFASPTAGIVIEIVRNES